MNGNRTTWHVGFQPTALPAELPHHLFQRTPKWGTDLLPNLGRLPRPIVIQNYKKIFDLQNNFLFFFCGPCRVWTYDLVIMSDLLWPTELRVHCTPWWIRTTDHLDVNQELSHWAKDANYRISLNLCQLAGLTCSLSVLRFFCYPWWIRTTINWTKTSCPAVRRKGNLILQYVKELCSKYYTLIYGPLGEKFPIFKIC